MNLCTFGLITGYFQVAIQNMHSFFNTNNPESMAFYRVIEPYTVIFNQDFNSAIIVNFNFSFIGLRMSRNITQALL